MYSTCFPDTRSKLCDEIEFIRDKMVVLGTDYGFLHPEVQRCSRQLDELIILFYNCTDCAHKLMPLSGALEESRV